MPWIWGLDPLVALACARLAIVLPNLFVLFVQPSRRGGNKKRRLITIPPPCRIDNCIGTRFLPSMVPDSGTRHKVSPCTVWGFHVVNVLVIPGLLFFFPAPFMGKLIATTIPSLPPRDLHTIPPYSSLTLPLPHPVIPWTARGQEGNSGFFHWLQGG